MGNMQGSTIDAWMRQNKATSGFDYLRLGLAVAVLVVHSFLTCYGRQGEAQLVWESPASAAARMILPMFFALSGFLVSGSIFRIGSIVGFLWLRAVRIVPALAVETTLSAVVLGVAFTTLAPGDYFSDPGFFHYFKNIYGHIVFTLPGVFLDHPLPGIVNQSLWTIPSEFECYALLVALMVTGAINARVLVGALVVLGSVAVYVQKVGFATAPLTSGPVYPKILVVAFLAGVWLYLCRDRIRLSRWLFLGALGASLVLHSDRQLACFGALPAAYVTVYLGLCTPRRAPFVFDGDYSYGLYLYAFPIQQTLVHLLPGMREWWINAALTLPLAFVFSYFSWHLVEKHAVTLKKYGAQDRLLPSIERNFRLYLRRLWVALRPNRGAASGRTS